MPRSNQWRRTLYRERIEKLAPGYDPAHVEAYIRLSNPVGDYSWRAIESLSPGHLASEVAIACRQIDDHGPWLSDLAAKCFGLRPKKRAS